MQNKKIYQIIIAAMFVYTGALEAQTSNSLGTYTPYSMFGAGEIVRQGTPYNRMMGGIGLALRDHRHINYLNPAAITARDTLLFMLDFGVESQNIYHTDNSTKSAFNTFNMSHIVFSFPIYRKSAMMVGFSPYSHVGYKFEEKEKRPEYISELGDITYQHYGEGSINQLFLGAAVSLSKNVSVGIQGIYYFGALYKNNRTNFSSSGYHSIFTMHRTDMESFAGKLGLQYAGKINHRSVLSAGASFLLPSTLKGESTQLGITVEESKNDTIYQSTLSGAQMKIPAEFAAGVSFGRKYYLAEENMNRWMVGFDYTYQDWTKVAFLPTPGVDFGTARKSAYKFGFEFTPDFNDPRYVLKRWTYRGGVYYERSYMKLNGRQVCATGVTVGLSIPVFRGSNILNLGIDMGQRGSLRDPLIRERYVVFQISTSLYDKWFQKIKYD